MLLKFSTVEYHGFCGFRIACVSKRILPSKAPFHKKAPLTQKKNALPLSYPFPWKICEFAAARLVLFWESEVIVIRWRLMDATLLSHLRGEKLIFIARNG